jgi:hypothetical protein
MNTQTIYPIYPPLKKSVSLNSISITIYELKLFESVKIACTLYDLDGNIQDTKLFFLQGDDYKAWSNDDTYIINYCKKQLQTEI